MTAQEPVMSQSASHHYLSRLPGQQLVLAYASSYQKNITRLFSSLKSSLPFVIKSKRSKRKSK